MLVTLILITVKLWIATMCIYQCAHLFVVH